MTDHFRHEALALSTRLDSVQPFSLLAPMVAAAGVARPAQRGIEELLTAGKETLRSRIRSYLRYVQAGEASPEEMQGQFALLKIHFNALLDQLDIFADVLTQRSEHGTGVWIAGLDVLAYDGLRFAKPFAELPPLVCYLERGHGAAIRRARTRLPGGNPNPVAVIQVPRERMVASGIASSLIHEVGHQAAALLDLIPSVKTLLAERQRTEPSHAAAWRLLDRWISEILADFWASASLGIGATTGLMGVVSLPRYFVFRMSLDDPHPFPWIRAMISIEFGRVLFPHPQWQVLANQWRTVYPPHRENPQKQAMLAELEEILPRFARDLANHRPPALGGRMLAGIFPTATLQPAILKNRFDEWKSDPDAILRAPPTMVLAVLSQARFDRRLHPLTESRLLTRCLRHWAINRLL